MAAAVVAMAAAAVGCGGGGGGGGGGGSGGGSGGGDGGRGELCLPMLRRHDQRTSAAGSFEMTLAVLKTTSSPQPIRRARPRGRSSTRGAIVARAPRGAIRTEEAEGANA